MSLTQMDSITPETALLEALEASHAKVTDGIHFAGPLVKTWGRPDSILAALEALGWKLVPHAIEAEAASPDTGLDALRALSDAATPGPWEQGNPWLIAGVMGAYGPDRCAYCSDGGEKNGAPVWTGRRDINGTQRWAHVHRDLRRDGDDGHVITGPLHDGHSPSVAGNYDYEQGGIVASKDAAFIVALVNWFRLAQPTGEPNA